MKKWLAPLITFCFVFALMLIGFAKAGMYPFGNEQIMIIDSWHQYYPILVEYHAKLRSFDSMFYSWSTGLGTSFIPMRAYYAASPLNLLSISISPDYLREVMLFITIVKIALAGAFFTYSTQTRNSGLPLVHVLCGMLYGLSGYFMGYYWGIMWLDGAMLLPLLVLGLKFLIQGKSSKLFIITYTYILISNFYVAIFISYMIVIYGIGYYFLVHDKLIINDFFDLLKRGTLSVLTSLGLSALILVPVFFGMQNAYGLQSGNPTSYTTYSSILDVVNRLFGFVKPTVISGLPYKCHVDRVYSSDFVFCEPKYKT